MNKTIVGAVLSLAFITPSHALVPGGSDNLPWKASADIANNVSAHTSILVTAATYTECVQQFQDAMDSHAYYHNDTFENIKYCSYKPIGNVVGGYAELALEESLKDLEDLHNIKEYTAKRDSLIEQYNRNNPVLPQAPKR